MSLARLALFAAALSLPAAALAQFDLTVDPDRLDGTDFFFLDDNQGGEQHR